MTWQNATGEASEAGNLNDLEARIEAALPAFNQRTWTQKTSATPLSADILNDRFDAHGVDVWATQANPASVTDWGPIVSTLVAGGAKRLLFRAQTFPITTAISLGTVRGLVFEGVAGLTWADNLAGTNVAQLLWKGTGSGVAFNVSGTDGMVLKDLWLNYDSSSYTGDLIQTGVLTTFERCQIGPAPVNHVSLKTARSLVKTDNSVMPIFRNCSFRGAAAAIRGWESGGTIAGNDMIVADSNFCSCVSFLRNIGINWRLHNLTFEFTDGAVDHAIDSDVACTSTFEMIGCNFWDQSDATAIPVKQASNNTWKQAIFRGGFFDIFFSKHFELLGPANIVRLDGIKFSSTTGQCPTIMDFGTSGGGATKQNISIIDCDLDGGAITNLDGGHGDINIRGRGLEEHFSHRGHVRTVPRGTNPTSAPAAGATNFNNQSLESGSTDEAGIIRLSIAGSGASNTGALIDITFAKAGIGTPIVLLSPIHVTSFTDLTDAHTAKVYAMNRTTTGWTIACVTAIPASKACAWAYRVIWKA